MNVQVRPGTTDDVDACGLICYEAFRDIAVAHGYAPDFESVGEAQSLLAGFLGTPSRYSSLVAEQNSVVIGSAFTVVDDPVWGVGPVTVSPNSQNSGAGRALLTGILERYRNSDARGIRLVQTSYHLRSLALYTKLGFDPRESLACVRRGPDVLIEPPRNHVVRLAEWRDFEACAALHLKVQGFSRDGQIRSAIASATAKVVERHGAVVGYATDIAFSGHAVAEDNDGIKALLCSVRQFGGPGVLVPTSNSELLRWCLSTNMRIVQLETLMTQGEYQASAGSYLPSIMF